MSIDRTIRPRIAPVEGLITRPYLGPGDEWQRWPRSQAEGEEFHGVTYSSIYDGDDDLLIDLVGSVDLVLQGNENLQLPTPFAGKNAAGLVAEQNSGFKGSDSSALDMDTESMMVVAFIYVHTAVSGNSQFMAKGSGATRRYSGEQNSVGRLSYTARDASGDGGHVHTVQVAADHVGYVGGLIMGNNFTAGEAYIDTDLGSDSEDSSDLVACGNGSIGRFGGGSAAAIDFLWAGIARGANGELSAASRQQLLRRVYRPL